ncbi:MAG TPA: hypothetical protein VK787_15135 [Puia sp.]|jgi:hypothetical protein|nr:hypothetical protein [Puia sp.]
MAQRIIVVSEDELRLIVKETVEAFYDKIYQNRNEMQLIPAKEEIINRKELSKRLDITEPTIIRWERKKKIPVMRIGSAIRYNWKAVIKSLEKN